jgi:hypothetical protein
MLWRGRLSRGQALGLAVSGGLLSISGLMLMAFRYLMPQQNPFSSFPNDLWPWFVALHVFPAPVFFFFVGSIWWKHIQHHWQGRSRRTSGAVLILAVTVLTVTGYLLYFVADEFWVSVWRVAHAVSGALGIALYIMHAAAGLRMLSQGESRAKLDSIDGTASDM